MAARALCFVVALCAIQASQAEFGNFFNLTEAVSAITNTVDTLKNNAESSINSTLGKIDTQVKSEVSRLKANLTSAIADISAQVQQLVKNAETEGIAASDCGLKASANLTAIDTALPVSLARCYTDNFDTFNYYINNIKKDINASYQAIKDAVSASSNCGFLEYIPCNTAIFLNASKVVQKEDADVAFQLVDSGTASINLVATITQCDEEKSTQAVLDAYNVIPATKKCIAAKKAELSNSTTSS